MRSLKAEGPVRIPELLLRLLLHHRSAPEPVVPHGIGTEGAVVGAPLDYLGIHEPLVRTVPELAVVAEGIVEATLGPNSKENFWLEFWLEKSLAFWIEIPYSEKMSKNG